MVIATDPTPILGKNMEIHKMRRNPWTEEITAVENYSIPVYSQSASSQIIEQSNSAIMNNLESMKTLSSGPDRIKRACSAFLDAGFGTGIAIVSNLGADNQAVATLDNNMKKLVATEEGGRAFILQIPKLDSSGAVDPRVEIPNWKSTVGATLPAWSSAQSNADLVSLILNQILANCQAIGLWDKSSKTKQSTAEIFSTMFHSEFLFGVIEAIMYAKPQDINAMPASLRLGSKEVSPRTMLDVLKRESAKFNPVEKILKVVFGG